MKILITGAAGMVGQKLVRRIMEKPALSGATELLLHDLVKASGGNAELPAKTFEGSIGDREQAVMLAALRPDIVFHLAAIVSGEAERDLEKGWLINAEGSKFLLEALRHEHEKSGGTYRPRFVFSSSIAVFGGPYPERIGDDFLCAPQTSYGAQKAVTELMVADYSRRGIVDGLSIRLPTICVRPGKPNLAASSFYSGIIREPLNGQEAILPVSGDIRHWHASPRSAAGFMLHAATLDTSLLNGRYSLNMPGVSCTVDEQIEALRAVAGNDAVALIKPVPDDAIARIVGGWPRDFVPARARSLGFTAESSFGEIIQVYLDDDLRPATS